MDSATSQQPAKEEVPFRFLDLPAELRERVYHFALGGRVVHAAVPGAGTGHDGNFLMKMALCCASPCDLEILGTPPTDRVPKEGDWFLRHWDPERGTCYQPLRHSVELCLFRASKQVYKEAKPAFFINNTFAFTSPWELEAFARFVGSAMFGRIHHVLLQSTNNRRKWATSAAPPSDISTLPFGHLQSLDVFVELVPADLLDGYGDTVETVQGQDRRLARLSGFSGFQPQRVRVIINDDTSCSPRDADLPVVKARASQIGRKAWAERVKTTILRQFGTDEVEYAARRSEGAKDDVG